MLKMLLCLIKVIPYLCNMHPQFPPHSKVSWLDNVKKELPEGKTLEDLLLNRGLYDHDGFSWPSEQNSVNGLIPSEEWQILAECLYPAVVMQSLYNGAESILIKPEHSESIENFLQGVHIGYIDTLIDASFCDFDACLHWKNNLDSNDQNRVILMADQYHEDFFFYINCEKANKENLLSTAIKIFQDWDQPCSGWIVEHTINADFYGEIAWQRALRLLFLRISEIKSTKKNLKIVARLKGSGEDKNQDLIRFSYQGLSAVLGGCNYLTGMEWGRVDDEYARIVQNLQHLMKQEGKLHFFRDAMAGSYFMEEITRALVDAVWSECM